MACHEEDVFACGEMRKESPVLDDVTDPAAEFGNIEWRDECAVESNRAGIRFEQSNDETEQG